MRNAVLILFFFLNCISITYAFDDKIIESYFVNLKLLEYQNAAIEAETINDKNYREKLKLLATILINKKDIKVDSLSLSLKADDFEKALTHLIIGYNRIYGENPDGLAAFKNFTTSLELAEKMRVEYLSRAALIALLELFKKEVFIGSNQYQYYLDRLYSLTSSISDEVIYALYNTIFLSKGKANLKESSGYIRSFKKLDILIKKLPEKSKLRVTYNYEKAILGKITKDYATALFYFNNVLHLAKNEKQFETLCCVVNWQMADTYLLLKQLDNSLIYIEKSEKCAKTTKDNFYDLRLKSKIMAASEDYQEAYINLSKSLNLEYALDYKNNTLESSIETVKNKTEKLKSDNVILETQKTNLRNGLVFFGFIIALGSGIAILLQKNTSKKRLLAEQEALLKQERVDNLLKEQELVSIDAMIAGQEKERQRVANELHDDLGSLMATIKLHFDNSKVSKKDPALQNAQKLLEEAYQKVRSMAHSKNSGVMSDQGLLPAIKKMAQVITETNALKVSVEDFGMGDRLENSLELNLFRMVQELIANTIKHAEASKVSIQLTQHKDNLNIIIEDNGKGFDRSKVDASKTGMGLTTIEKRVEHLEGNFTVDSVIGKGTSILIDIPL